MHAKLFQLATILLVGFTFGALIERQWKDNLTDRVLMGIALLTIVLIVGAVFGLFWKHQRDTIGRHLVSLERDGRWLLRVQDLWRLQFIEIAIASPREWTTQPAALLLLVLDRRTWLAVPALLLAGVAFLFSSHNQFTPIGVTSWLISIAFFLLAYWEGEPREWETCWKARWTRLARLPFEPLRVSWVPIGFAAILVVGVFFYFYRLDLVPAEMTSDHAEKILDTYDILHGQRPIFFERNTGREPLQFYMNAAVVALGLAPLDYLALKIVTALLGLLTVPGVFLLAREMFDEKTALLSAFFVAVSIWPVAIARVGLRFPLTPVFIAPMVFFLARALKRQRRNDFLMTGLMLGAGLYGYSPFRVAVLVVAAFLFLWLFIGRNIQWKGLRDYASKGLVLFATTGIVFVPLLRYSLEKPDNFWFRALSRVSTEQPLSALDALRIFLSNTLRALMMFNGQGDAVWVNTIPNDPIVDPIIGTLLLLGTAYAVYRLIRFRDWACAFLLVGGFLMLLPSTLSIAFPQENPSVVRTGGAIPFVMILAALPLAVAWQRLGEGIAARAGVIALIVLCFMIAQINFYRYFTVYDEQYRKSAWNSTEIAAALKEFTTTLGDEKHAYLIPFSYWVDHRAVGIHMGDPYWDNRILNSQQLRDQALDPSPKMYVLNKEDTDSLTLLKRLYPDGAAQEFRSRTPTREFYMFFVPGGAAQ
jgi:Dolichyl-phosphate-mannose-protein mannosyltransferase